LRGAGLFARPEPSQGDFFIFSPNLKQIPNLGRFEKKIISNPFGPATMHGGANPLHPAMHGGGVGPPHGV